eukprot:CAMPEP_0119141956 /NCGR_PEP_ID=MMETSP1310-20130426/31869_1 /TAXON_ID=464262 /ORGANISM="Genus nov. species nov., Strain RCC2339" /LENGTH=113 /DNA_ID=CAMNT_0007133457 /DNA_START=1 /DNA_END=339 /DNA_ORIENTATION=-
MAYGILGSLYGGLQMVGAPLMGYAMDLYSRRLVLLVSLSAAMLSYALVAVAGSMLMLYASRVPVGLLKQTQTASRAIVMDVTDGDARLRHLGYLSAARNCGYVFGPLLGSVLV